MKQKWWRIIFGYRGSVRWQHFIRITPESRQWSDGLLGEITQVSESRLNETMWQSGNKLDCVTLPRRWEGLRRAATSRRLGTYYRPETYFRVSGMFENHTIECNIIEIGQVVPNI